VEHDLAIALAELSFHHPEAVCARRVPKGGPVFSIVCRCRCADISARAEMSAACLQASGAV